MKTPTRFSIVLCCVLFISFSPPVQAQNESIKKNATLFADSMITAFRFQNWDNYFNLSYSGAVKYYGGPAGYMTFTKRSFEASKAIIQENPETLSLMQLENDINEWQCVFERKRQYKVDGKITTILTYLIGQSKDDGETWKFFDMGFNPPENVIYIMPDVFTMLAIPQRSVVTRDEFETPARSIVKKKNT